MMDGWAQNSQGTFGWKSPGVMGDIVYAPVRLDGRSLFSIAAKRHKEGNFLGGLSALQTRRNRLENRLYAQLQYLLKHAVDPELLQVVTAQLNQQMTVQIILDGKPSQPIVTITALDAEIYGLSEAEVAELYAQQIRQGLILALEERQPAAQRSQLQGASLEAAIATLVIALLFGWQRQIGRSRWPLRQTYHHQQEVLTQLQTSLEMERDKNQEVSEQQQKLFDLKRQIERKTWQKHILQLSLVLVGLVSLGWILQRFPQTRSLGIQLFKQPIGLLLIGLSIAIATILSHSLIDWILAQWVGTEDQLPLAQIERRRRRMLILSPIWKHITTALLVFAGILLIYSFFSLATGLTLFTEIGVLGVVISLVLQSSIKDALTGWMLLARDAFTIGDIVMIKEVSGVVESMGLFMTQIRSSPGHLVTLRNGEITTITNCSKDWSRMDFTVLVDYSTDVEQAITILRAVFQTMQNDPDWQSHLIGEPDILGVERFEQNGILLKIRSQTQAGQQFNVTREFQLRLNQAFQDTGIKIPIPQREVRYRGSDLGVHPSKHGV